MATLTATASPLGGSLRHWIDVNGRHAIVTDEPESLGGSDTAPAPHELLPAMVAACVSTMVMLYAHQRGWELGEMRVDVSYDTDVAPRPVAVTVHLPDSLTADQVERLARVVDSCPVKRALEAGFDFDRQLVTDLRSRPLITPGSRC